MSLSHTQPTQRGGGMGTERRPIWCCPAHEEWGGDRQTPSSTGGYSRMNLQETGKSTCSRSGQGSKSNKKNHWNPMPMPNPNPPKSKPNVCNWGSPHLPKGRIKTPIFSPKGWPQCINLKPAGTHAMVWLWKVCKRLMCFNISLVWNIILR